MKWIDIKIKKPSKAGDYLIMDSNNDCAVVKYTKKRGFVMYILEELINKDVVYWMNIPEPPK